MFHCYKLLFFASTAIFYCIGNSYALERAPINNNQNTLSLSGQPSHVISHDEPSENSHEFSLTLPLSPYIGFGDDDDLFRNIQSEWRNHSYESQQEQQRKQKRWSGLKLRLNRMFKMNFDPKQRRFRSTLAVTPKTKVKVRANFREVRANLTYRW